MAITTHHMYTMQLASSLHRRWTAHANTPFHQGGIDCRRHATHWLQPHRALAPDICMPLIDLADANVFGQAWGTSVDVSTLVSTAAPQIFAVSIFPYAGFLYCLTRSGKTPPIALFGFYFLLAFVFATIPAGIYAKQAYGTTLANVDWLHGGAESLLTVTNLLVVLGFRKAIRDAEDNSAAQEDAVGRATDTTESKL